MISMPIKPCIAPVALAINPDWNIASSAGDDARADVNATFLSYTTPTAWTFGFNSKSTYNGETGQWSAPINGVVSKVRKSGPNCSVWVPACVTGSTRRKAVRKAWASG